MSPLPEALEIDAWLGGERARSGLGADAGKLAKSRKSFGTQHLLPGAAADPRSWQHPDVGWGLLLPENEDLPAKERATAADAPRPIRELVRSRPGAPIFRYDASWPGRHTHLRRYLADGSVQEPSMVGSVPGVAPGKVPRYLLIYGSPSEIPWSVQLTLNACAFVGRLDLCGEPLERYVGALLTDWAGAASDPLRPLVWAADDESGDITRLMRQAIAAPLRAKYDDDADLAPTWLERAGATAEKLVDALAETRPGLVVLTSHGVTAPLDDAGALTRALGLPVGSDHAALGVDALLGAWDPGGAIVYSRACCSAGADATTGFAGLVEEGGAVDRVLRGVAASGARVAPLPRALLGASTPARAFVGHVEPTFDWTIRAPGTGQRLTHALVDALYQRLFTRSPIGHALEVPHAEGPKLLALHDAAIEALQRGEDTLGTALALELMARDHQRLVVLGDPTVALPLPPA